MNLECRRVGKLYLGKLGKTHLIGKSIFARAETPAAAERALRDAHACLAFDIA